MRTIHEIGLDIVIEAMRILRTYRTDDMQGVDVHQLMVNANANTSGKGQFCQDTDEQVMEEAMQLLQTRLVSYLEQNRNICLALLRLKYELEQMLPVAEATVANALEILRRIRSVEGRVTVYEVMISFEEFTDESVTNDKCRAAELVEHLLDHESYIDDFDLKGALDRIERKILAMPRVMPQ